MRARITYLEQQIEKLKQQNADLIMQCQNYVSQLATPLSAPISSKRIVVHNAMQLDRIDENVQILNGFSAVPTELTSPIEISSPSFRFHSDYEYFTLDSE